jgi:hypothetical protein
MSAPRLPTGWFAAGREFAQALTILSDGAFKLYVYACLRAGRHTVAFVQPLRNWRRPEQRHPSSMNVDELEERAVCCIRRDRRNSCSKSATASGRTRGNCHPATHLSRRWSSSGRCAACSWLRPAFRPASQPPMKSWRSACTGEASPWNRSRGPSCWDVPASMSPLNAGTRIPITSLQYFADVVEEVIIGDTGKLLGAAPLEGAADGTTVAAGPSSKTMMPQPVGQPRLPHFTAMPAHIEWNACPHET